MRARDLVRAVKKQIPSANENSLSWNISRLDQEKPEVTKPRRGWFEIQAPAPVVEVTSLPRKGRRTEESQDETRYYSPFASYLVEDLGECNEAEVLGGAIMGPRWGTPDVIGVYKPQASDVVKFTPEIISAEIKSTWSEAVTGFGQAVAYRLFSTKSFLVLPETNQQGDLDRIEALCTLHGVGLVLLSEGRPPDFKTHLRAQRFVPDMFYVNQFAEQLRRLRTDVFNRLF